LRWPAAKKSDTPACQDRSRPTIASKEDKSGKMKNVAFKLIIDTKHFLVIVVAP